jgi:hypothetical protein
MPDAVTVTIERDHMRVMKQPVQHRRGCRWLVKWIPPSR